MSKILVGMLAAAGMAAGAAAQVMPPSQEGRALVIDLQGNVIGYSDEVVYPQVDVEVYDNWRAAAQGGASNLTGLFNTGGTEIADDLNMTAGGLLGSAGFNVANTGAVAWNTMTGGTGNMRFYRQSDGAFLGGFGFSMPALGLVNPGGSIRLNFPDGSLAGLNIQLHESTVWMSIQFTAINGTYADGTAIALADAGMQLRGPINTGTSTDTMFSFGPTPPAGNFNFNGQPLANGGLFVKLVPAPGSLALLGLGGLAAFRRRR